MKHASVEQLLYTAGAMVAACVFVVLQTIIHEAGHLIFGLLSGYQFSSFRIFSFMWLKENEKIKLKRLSIMGTAGQCLMTPPDLKNGKIPVMLYNLGGVLLNLIVSTISFVVAVATFQYWWSILWLLFAVAGYICAITNGIPLKLGAMNNDGYNAFSLSKNPEAMRAFWVQMKVNDQQARGVRLRNMPEEWFQVPTDPSMKNSIISAVGVFACNRLMDEGKFEQAEQLMRHLLEIDSGMVGIHRNLLIGDRIYVELTGENRPDVLERLCTREWKKFVIPMKNFPSILRTQYTYMLLHEGNMEQAKKLKLEFEKVSKTYPYQSDIQSERELMEMAENKFDMQNDRKWER